MDKIINLFQLPPPPAALFFHLSTPTPLSSRLSDAVVRDIAVLLDVNLNFFLLRCDS